MTQPELMHVIFNLMRSAAGNSFNGIELTGETCAGKDVCYIDIHVSDAGVKRTFKLIAVEDKEPGCSR